MTKITTEHLARNACVYVRQSTADQLAHNHESRRRQYGLVDRAKQLGWSNVEVIDDDLGRSGGGIARPGFERLRRWSALGDHLFVDRILQTQRRRTLRLLERRTHAHGQWTSRQPSRRTAAVGLETIDSCQDLTDVQQTDAYGR